jgi:hypothetical protein
VCSSHDHLRRHQGNREAWLGALLPLAPSEPPTSASTTEIADPASTAPGPAAPAIASAVRGSPRAAIAAPRRTVRAFESAVARLSGLPVFELAIGALVAALGVAGALLWWSSRGAPPSLPGGPAALGRPGNSPGGGGRSFAAVLPGNLDGCRLR